MDKHSDIHVYTVDIPILIRMALETQKHQRKVRQILYNRHAPDGDVPGI